MRIMRVKRRLHFFITPYSTIHKLNIKLMIFSRGPYSSYELVLWHDTCTCTYVHVYFPSSCNEFLFSPTFLVWAEKARINYMYVCSKLLFYASNCGSSARRLTVTSNVCKCLRIIFCAAEPSQQRLLSCFCLELTASDRGHTHLIVFAHTCGYQGFI
jgi:hypothetical protein